VLVAERQRRDDDRHADERAGDPSEEGPEKYREQYQEWRNGKCAACDPGLEIASDNELDQVQAHEHDERHLQGTELRDGELRSEIRRDEWSYEWNVVDREGDRSIQHLPEQA
jgi:hypothetical protein